MKRRSIGALYCSFCGKRRAEVYMLVAGGGGDVTICDECVIDAQRIITTRKIEDAATRSLRLVQQGK